MNFGQALSGCIEELAKKNGWSYKDDCFWPEAWGQPEEKPGTCYGLEWFGEEGWWLFHASGSENSGIGFALYIDPELIKGKAYKAKIEEFYEQNREKLKGAEIGKQKNNIYLSFPFKVSPEDLAEAYPDWQDALEEPVGAAFANLLNAHKTVDAFLKKLAKEKKGES